MEMHVLHDRFARPAHQRQMVIDYPTNDTASEDGQRIESLTERTNNTPGCVARESRSMRPPEKGEPMLLEASQQAPG